MLTTQQSNTTPRIGDLICWKIAAKVMEKDGSELRHLAVNAVYFWHKQKIQSKYLQSANKREDEFFSLCMSLICRERSNVLLDEVLEWKLQFASRTLEKHASLWINMAIAGI